MLSSKFLIIILFLVELVAGCSNSKSNNSTVATFSGQRVADKPMIFATIPNNNNQPSPVQADGTVHQKLPGNILQLHFATWGGGAAYTEAHGEKTSVVYNGSPGSQFDALGLVKFSPDGSRIAYGALVNGKWHMYVDGTLGQPFNTIKDQMFSPDGRHVAYQAMKGDLWHLVVDSTVNEGTTKRYRKHEFSGDSRTLIVIDELDRESRTGKLMVTDINFKNIKYVANDVTDMVLNGDRTFVAALSINEKKMESVIQFDVAKPEIVTKSAEYDKIYNRTYAPTGRDFFFYGERQGRVFGVFNGKEEAVPAGFTVGNPVINMARKSVGVLMPTKEGFFYYQMFRNNSAKVNKYVEAEGLVYHRDGDIAAFAARKGSEWVVVINGIEGSAYDRVASPKFSLDGKYLVYRARKDGKRFVVVCDVAGKVLRQHQSYDQVFDVQFTLDGKSVAYAVMDGNQQAWKVEPL